MTTPPCGSKTVTSRAKCSPGHAALCDLARRSPTGRGLKVSVPRHDFGRCDGHHEMVDFRLRKKAAACACFTSRIHARSAAFTHAHRDLPKEEVIRVRKFLE